MSLEQAARIMPITNDQWYIDQAETSIERIDSREAKYLNQLEGTYQRTSRDVTKEINAFYARYDNPTQSQANIELPINEGIMAREDAIESADSIVYGSSFLKKDLERIAKKPRITRQEGLNIAVMGIYAKLGNTQQRGMDKVFTETLDDKYLRNIWTIDRGRGFGVPRNPLSDTRIKSILNSTITGQNYSSNLWYNTKAVADIVKREIGTGLSAGSGMDEIARKARNDLTVQLSKKANISAGKAAKRLVRTEMTNVSTNADANSYNDTDIEWYFFLATLDSRTTEFICAPLDGQRFKVEDMEIGTNAPSMHPNCRSTTRPDTGTASQQRRARDAEGNSILVPGDTTYADWKKAVGL